MSRGVCLYKRAFVTEVVGQHSVTLCKCPIVSDDCLALDGGKQIHELRNMPEEGRPEIQHGGSLKSRTLCDS
jgi:hypothetical protein